MSRQNYLSVAEICDTRVGGEPVESIELKALLLVLGFRALEGGRKVGRNSKMGRLEPRTQKRDCCNRRENAAAAAVNSPFRASEERGGLTDLWQANLSAVDL